MQKNIAVSIIKDRKNKHKFSHTGNIRKAELVVNYTIRDH